MVAISERWAQSLVVGHLVVNNEWFEGCCDAGDVIDGEECIISITRGSGGNVNRFLPGVGVHVNDRREGTTGCEKFPDKADERLSWPVK